MNVTILMLYIKLNKNEMGYHNWNILNEKSQFPGIHKKGGTTDIYIYIYNNFNVIHKIK